MKDVGILAAGEGKLLIFNGTDKRIATAPEGVEFKDVSVSPDMKIRLLASSNDVYIYDMDTETFKSEITLQGSVNKMITIEGSGIFYGGINYLHYIGPETN